MPEPLRRETATSAYFKPGILSIRRVVADFCGDQQADRAVVHALDGLKCFGVACLEIVERKSGLRDGVVGLG